MCYQNLDQIKINMKQRVADYLIDYIYKLGVKHLFQVTGRGSLFLNDAVAKHAEIESISLHHEQACSFAAMAYAEKTNNLGAWFQQGAPLLMFLRELCALGKMEFHVYIFLDKIF